MKVTVDKKRCIGCEQCVDITAKAFKISGTKAVLHPKVDLTDPEVIQKIKLACETCPQQAIKIDEDSQNS